MGWENAFKHVSSPEFSISAVGQIFFFMFEVQKIALPSYELQL